MIVDVAIFTLLIVAMTALIWPLVYFEKHRKIAWLLWMISLYLPIKTGISFFNGTPSQGDHHNMNFFWYFVAPPFIGLMLYLIRSKTNSFLDNSIKIKMFVALVLSVPGIILVFFA